MFLSRASSGDHGLPGSRAQPGCLQLGLTGVVIASSQPGQLRLGQPSGISLESAPRSERPHSASGRRGSWCLSVTTHSAAAAAPRRARAPVAALIHSGLGRRVRSAGSAPPQGAAGHGPSVGEPRSLRGRLPPTPRRSGAEGGGGGEVAGALRLRRGLLLDVHPQTPVGF